MAMTSGRSGNRPVSAKWIVLSVVIFTACELLLGQGLTRLLAGSTTSHMLMLRLEMVLMSASFLAGGFLIGVLSPGPRLLEPAIGAAITVVSTFFIAFFSPIMIYQASLPRMLIGGGVGFVVALFGAHLGEKVTGN
jgi:hypothetical protein